MPGHLRREMLDYDVAGRPTSLSGNSTLNNVIEIPRR
jgi:hypothetical protein